MELWRKRIGISARYVAGMRNIHRRTTPWEAIITTILLPSAAGYGVSP